MFSYYERDSALHRMNPTIKLGAILAGMIGLTVIVDPYTPGLLLLTGILLGRVLGSIPVRAMLRGLVPFLLIAFGFFWMHVLFPSPDNAVTVLAEIGPLTVYREGLLRGSGLALRILCFAGFSLIFVATTDPTEFILSLMQNLRLAPRFGYSILAAYRFFPLYQEQFRILRDAHRVRGVVDSTSINGAYRRLRRYAVPLLAAGVRQAERVAVAMEARGFTGKVPRTYYRRISVRPSDWLLAGGFLGLVVLTMALVYHLGLLRIWGDSYLF